MIAHGTLGAIGRRGRGSKRGGTVYIEIIDLNDYDYAAMIMYISSEVRPSGK